MPLSSIYLDVAAKLENKNKKKKEGERERKEDDEKENKLRTLLYSCNIIFCWIKKLPLSLFLIFTPESKQVSSEETYFVPQLQYVYHYRSLRSRL